MFKSKKNPVFYLRLFTGLVLLSLLFPNHSFSQEKKPAEPACEDQYKEPVSCPCTEKKKIPNGVIALQFKSNGQLVSYPPEFLKGGSKIMGSIQLDDHFWIARINEVVANRIKTLENMTKYFNPKQILTYGLTTELAALRLELVGDLDTYINSLPVTLLSPEQKSYYLKKIRSYGINIVKPTYPLKLIPPIEELVNPEIKLYYSYYNEKGIRINSDGTLYCNGATDFVLFKSCCTCNSAGAHYDTDLIEMSEKAFEVKYELRMANNLNKVQMCWKSCVPYQEGINTNLEYVKNLFTDPFDAEFKKTGEEVKKLQKNKDDPTVQVTPLLDKIKKYNKDLDIPINNLNNVANAPWFAAWLWLNNGIPKVNPFDAKALLFATPDDAKLTPADKARYSLFDNMVTKGALKIEDISQIDTGFKNMTRIKAAMDATAAAPGNDPALYDRLLYQGLLKISPSDSLIFMRHLDVANNYLIMAIHPKKEIDETNKLYILSENTPPALKQSIGFTTAAPPEDNSAFTLALGGAQDEHALGPAATLTPAQRDVAVKQIIKGYADAQKKIAALKELGQKPVLPVFFDEDQTPDYITQVLEHNDLYDAPVIASYSVKTTAADNTQEEVNTGSYRINKLYRFRFKAGLAYSLLKNKQYTLVSPGQYTLNDPPFGVDGTFGIQTYFQRQDLRSRAVAWRPFVYVGLSMRKISENFYLGAGFEPLSGLALGVNAHFGKMQELTGANGIPSGITDSWGRNVAFSVMIDGALFVKLFSFGSSNKAAVGF